MESDGHVGTELAGGFELANEAGPIDSGGTWTVKEGQRGRRLNEAEDVESVKTLSRAVRSTHTGEC